jgi:hypothetical protein
MAIHGIHFTRNGQRFISNSTPGCIACEFCFNKHRSPWHPAAECPLKDITYIFDRNVRERVIQHNALHGAVNKIFSKMLDTLAHSQNLRPPTATANHVSFGDSPDDAPPTNAIIHVSDHNIHEDPLLQDEALHEIFHSEHFMVSFVAQANIGHSSLPQSFLDTCALDDLLFDPEHYQTYSS